MNKALLIISIAAVFVLNSTIVTAGGRPVGKRRLFISTGISYFTNSKFSDQNSQTQTYANNGRNLSLSGSLSAEYGFSRRVSLMASIPFVSNTVKSDLSSNTVNTLGDGQVGVRYYIANISYRTYFSVQTNLIFPLYVNTDAVNRGYGKLGGSVTLAGSGDFKMFGRPFFFETDVSTNKFFGGDAPFQGTVTAAIGFGISKYYSMSFSESSTLSYSITKDLNPLSSAPAKDYASNQITAGIARGLGKSRSLSLSYTTFISGRNTAIGSSFSLGYGFKY